MGQTQLETSSQGKIVISGCMISVLKSLRSLQKLRENRKETNQKWVQRREDDVRNMKLNMTPDIHTILGQLCDQEGIKVHYSDVDCDDTIATYAQHFGADILSRDRDFLRYRNANYKIFDGYQIVEGKLCLIQRSTKNQKYKPIVEPRDLLKELPQTHSYTPFKEKVQRLKISYRNASTPLNRLFGNLNDNTLNYRSHYYHKLGINFPVQEMYPYWSKEKQDVLWTDHFNIPQYGGKEIDQLFEDPLTHAHHYITYITKFKPNKVSLREWNNHIFCQLYNYFEPHYLFFNKNVLEMYDQIKPFVYQQAKQKKQAVQNQQQKDSQNIKNNDSDLNKNYIHYSKKQSKIIDVYQEENKQIFQKNQKKQNSKNQYIARSNHKMNLKKDEQDQVQQQQNFQASVISQSDQGKSNSIHQQDQEEEKVITKTKDFKKQEKKFKLLYVDALNYARVFFLNQNFWDLDSAQENIKRFVEAAYNSCYKVEVFIDAGKKSEEVLNKWYERRERQVETCIMEVPTCVTAFIGEMFRNLQVPVHYSVVDNDDTLACFANHYGADVLSGDTDFLRYRGRKYKIYKDFKIDESSQKLVLTERSPFKHRKPKYLLKKLPQTINQYPLLKEVFEDGRYYRGSPTSLTKYTGNLHQLIKPLRQVFYRIMKVDFEVFELYPDWDHKNNSPFWIEEYVKPADNNLLNQLRPLFENITSMIDYFINDLVRPEEIKDLDWNNHVFGFCALISELVAEVNGKDMMLYLKECEEYMLKNGMIKNFGFVEKTQKTHQKKKQEEVEQNQQSQSKIEKQKQNV
eukprot:403335913